MGGPEINNIVTGSSIPARRTHKMTGKPQLTFPSVELTPPNSGVFSTFVERKSWEGKKEKKNARDNGEEKGKRPSSPEKNSEINTFPPPSQFRSRRASDTIIHYLPTGYYSTIVLVGPTTESSCLPSPTANAPKTQGYHANDRIFLNFQERLDKRNHCTSSSLQSNSSARAAAKHPIELVSPAASSQQCEQNPPKP